MLKRVGTAFALIAAPALIAACTSGTSNKVRADRLAATACGSYRTAPTHAAVDAKRAATLDSRWQSLADDLDGYADAATADFAKLSMDEAHALRTQRVSYEADVRLDCKRGS